MRFFRFPTRRVPLLVAAVLLAGTVLPSIHASVRIPAETEDRLRAIYERGEFSVRGFQADWLADGSGYTRLERAPGAGGPVLVHYEAASGKRTVLVSLDELRPPAASGPVIMEGYAFSPDGAVLLIRANARPRSDGIDQVSELWTFDRRSGLLWTRSIPVCARFAMRVSAPLSQNSGWEWRPPREETSGGCPSPRRKEAFTWGR